MKKIPIKNIKRFITTLAFFNETYPDKNPLINTYWKRIRNKHARDCLKYGKCEVCGDLDLLGEYGLTWICDKPECNKKVAKDYDKILMDWHYSSINAQVMCGSE